jgi:hypothetical protein
MQDDKLALLPPRKRLLLRRDRGDDGLQKRPEPTISRPPNSAPSANATASPEATQRSFALLHVQELH